MLHAEKLRAGEVAMGGAAGTGVGVERGSPRERRPRERPRGTHGRRYGAGAAPVPVRAWVWWCVCVWRGLCCVRVVFTFYFLLFLLIRSLFRK